MGHYGECSDQFSHLSGLARGPEGLGPLGEGWDGKQPSVPRGSGGQGDRFVLLTTEGSTLPITGWGMGLITKSVQGVSASGLPNR